VLPPPENPLRRSAGTGRGLRAWDVGAGARQGEALGRPPQPWAPRPARARCPGACRGPLTRVGGRGGAQLPGAGGGASQRRAPAGRGARRGRGACAGARVGACNRRLFAERAGQSPGYKEACPRRGAPRRRRARWGVHTRMGGGGRGRPGSAGPRAPRRRRGPAPARAPRCGGSAAAGERGRGGACGGARWGGVSGVVPPAVNCGGVKARAARKSSVDPYQQPRRKPGHKRGGSGAQLIRRAPAAGLPPHRSRRASRRSPAAPQRPQLCSALSCWPRRLARACSAARAPCRHPQSSSDADNNPSLSSSLSSDSLGGGVRRRFRP
jgi:hypothetical protein